MIELNARAAIVFLQQFGKNTVSIRNLPVLEFSVKDRAAELSLLHLQILEIPFYFRLSLFSTDIIEPVDFRHLFGTCENLHAVAVIKDVAYRLHFSIHASTDTVGADLSMNIIGEIQYCSSYRKLSHVTLRCYEINII